MDIRKLQHLDALAREGHFARAAQSLGVTQSALTRSIQAIEAELGLRLFDRGRGGVHLTRAGQALVADGRAILRQMRALERNMALLSARTVGEVRCGFGPLVAALVLEDVLTGLARDHPAVRVITRLGDVDELQGALHDGDLDFIAVSRPLVEHREELSVRPIGRSRLCAIVRRDHPLATKADGAGAAQRFPTIGGAAPAGVHAALDPAYAPTIVCDNYAVAAAVTLASDAIWVAGEGLADGRFAILPDHPMSQPLDFVIASLARRTLPPMALTAIELIVASLRRRERA